MTRRNQKYFLEVEWKNRQNHSKLFKSNYQVSSMAVAANRGLRAWRHSTELRGARPKNVTIRIERQETTTQERGAGKRKKLRELYTTLP